MLKKKTFSSQCYEIYNIDIQYCIPATDIPNLRATKS